MTVWNSLPIFPLPTTVLFPGIVLPLHIYEERYREMVQDALAGDRVMAIALYKGEYGSGDENAVYDVAGAGQIIHAEELSDGCYNIMLQGVGRVRLIEEVQSEKLYRMFRSEPMSQPGERELHAAQPELVHLQSTLMSLRAAVQKQDAQLVDVINSTSDPVLLSDILAATVVSNPHVQQQLLAADTLSLRLSTLIEALADVLLHLSASQNASSGAAPGDVTLN
ncbi:LON peptidase substrate-binding domain-containing protein [Myxococcota bacterium]|nr:LON peptidase substrate-binding domain-containing protein [Myxococcota bacterium]